MSQDLRPYSPLHHCPQCDGVIDPRAVRSSPLRQWNRPYPRRRLEGWCEHCLIGFRAELELREGNWQLCSTAGVRILRGETVRSIRTYAEQQSGVIQRKAS